MASALLQLAYTLDFTQLAPNSHSHPHISPHPHPHGLSLPFLSHPLYSICGPVYSAWSSPLLLLLLSLFPFFSSCTLLILSPSMALIQQFGGKIYLNQTWNYSPFHGGIGSTSTEDDSLLSSRGGFTNSPLTTLSSGTVSECPATLLLNRIDFNNCSSNLGKDRANQSSKSPE